ncbi:hypothetical protein CMUS01_14097 [Colletotrichum musicola]|uniref:Uncharacterized protein n=1 Tax=Colletotrichum musicola TaxID=2175873 RepID=A0A8H6MSM4_9PEZI|nr:hypothetical protein CMUS01_14097 [Colletotrichum musicola]
MIPTRSVTDVTTKTFTTINRQSGRRLQQQVPDLLGHFQVLKVRSPGLICHSLPQNRGPPRPPSNESRLGSPIPPAAMIPQRH